MSRGVAECLLVGSHATALGVAEHAARLQPARAGVAFERPDTRLAVSGARQAQSRRLAWDLALLGANVAHYLTRPREPEPESESVSESVSKSVTESRGRLESRSRPESEPRGRPEHFVDPDRLPDALAQWEVTALRVLHAQPPSVRDLAGVAQAEQALLVYTLVILNAAARASVIDPGDFDRQVRSRLETSQTAWGAVAASWPAQMTTAASPSLAGVEASAGLHRALDENTRDGNGWGLLP